MGFLYRKKPVEVRAFQYWGSIMDAPEWLLNSFYNDILYYVEDQLFIRTLEGDMTVAETDYIIEGIKGELYPCKQDIFEATYEKVEDK